MTETLLILDDDPFRHAMFRAAMPASHILSAYDVPSFHQLLQNAASIDLFALDHDLVTDECGCDAARHIGSSNWTDSPVLIHSNNESCAAVMRNILVQSGRQGRVKLHNIGYIPTNVRMSYRYTGDESVLLLEAENIQNLSLAIANLIAVPRWNGDDERIAASGLKLTCSDISERC